MCSSVVDLGTHLWTLVDPVLRHPWLATLAVGAALVAAYLVVPRAVAGSRSRAARWVSAERRAREESVRGAIVRLAPALVALFAFGLSLAEWRSRTEEGDRQYRADRYDRAFAFLAKEGVESKIAGINILDSLLIDRKVSDAENRQLLAVLEAFVARNGLEGVDYPIGGALEKGIKREVNAALAILARPASQLDGEVRRFPSRLILRFARLPEADLRHTSLRSAALSRSRLDGARLSPPFDGYCARFDGAELYGATFAGTEATKTQLSGADFSEAWLGVGHGRPAANFSHADLKHAVFDRAHGDGVSFRGAMIPNASFVASQLPRSDFSGADAWQAHFEKARLEGAIFDATWIGCADFSGADLSGAVWNPKGEDIATFCGTTRADGTQDDRDCGRPRLAECDRDAGRCIGE